MNCIIVDDEPLAREAIQLLIGTCKELTLLGGFGSANQASRFMDEHAVDLVFLDIQMPGTNGIEFAKSIAKQTLVIFTTAFSQYALDSYEVEAVDYLVKPVQIERFNKAVSKALSYAQLLKPDHSAGSVERFSEDYIFIKADRKIYKIHLKDILFIEGLKDYVVIHTEDQKIITAMNIKTIHEKLPQNLFVRVAKSYIINIRHIDSFDNNSIYIGKNEISIGNAYRSYFFDEFVTKKLLTR
ncbi:LytTR family DNA-binding domain-containing protein [Dyadobacter sp. CY261]|uniref:LytR/AlgR family response regulator transcription factor n=1 Tax=Dyadobacter sp. CY261 TaxID=2907203 RepID=UPI001F38C332|nr:LytTR family DNA-binding domain-containing protein [Dyadobacter sp. CY261]MCF0075302.1 LytTR family DNA-binding domain-containing protein [Dyadobacter sp. CY261]